MSGMLIGFIVVQILIFIVAIVVLKMVIFNSTSGAVKRLNDDAEAARAKQNELAAKIKEADETLTRRQKEADELTTKMITDAEHLAQQEKENMIAKARQEGEEIITKAQTATQRIRQELEKEMHLKAVDYASQILQQILSTQSKEAFVKQLVGEFVEGLQKVDMSRLGQEFNDAEIYSANPIETEVQQKILYILTQKLGRTIKINFKQDPNIVGGLVLKFGSLALDGSLQYLIREAGTGLKQKIESQGINN